MEVLDMVLAYDLTPRPNGTTHGADFSFTSGVFYRGKPRITVRRSVGPLPIVYAHVCQKVRYAVQYKRCKNATIGLLHDDVNETVAFLAELYPPCRDGIKGLHITYQRQQPVDYAAFKQLCRILKSMRSLELFRFEPPFNPAPFRNFIVDPEPGMINQITWHKDNIIRQLGYDIRVLQGYAWKNSRRAAWVQDLLTVDGNAEQSLREF